MSSDQTVKTNPCAHYDLVVYFVPFVLRNGHIVMLLYSLKSEYKNTQNCTGIASCILCIHHAFHSSPESITSVIVPDLAKRLWKWLSGPVLETVPFQTICKGVKL